MNRDPLYSSIERALERNVDPHLFQLCACDLLREAYPTLAPMVGGNDAGMDGSIGTNEGPFPLVCTTEPDVIGNLSKSLESNRKKHSGPKRVAVATTQKLTPARKRNLAKRASELGYTLENTHDRTYFINRLCRESKWRLQLLGVTGDPPALSVIPPNFRSLETEFLIGREAELAWLETTQGDLVLVGQPGSGKTYLHQTLAMQGKCLFVVRDDPTAIANAIRDQEPSVIVVDDAHIRQSLVELLRRTRTELGHKYAIHANVWPGHDAGVRKILSLPLSQQREIKKLSRRNLVRIINERGIFGPDELLHLLLAQCDGKPGLASALADICKRDGAERVWTGEALSDELLADNRLIRHGTEKPILASFALGGDSGMRLSDVAECLGFSPVELQSITTALGAGGVLEAVNDQYLQVRPPPLRAILVRDVFFNGANSLNPESLLHRAPSPCTTSAVLMSAVQRGARVSHDVLQEYVVACDHIDNWEHFGWVDRECAQRVLESFPDRVCAAAPGLLNFMPEQVLPRLLDADSTREETGFDHSADPRDRLNDWLFSDAFAPSGTTAKRKHLLSAVSRWVESGINGKEATLAWALSRVVKADFERHQEKPESRRTISFISGIVGEDDLTAITILWPTVLALIERLDPHYWKPILDEVENWCFPGRHCLGRPLPDTVLDLMERHSRQMLQDISCLQSSTDPVKLWVCQVAEWASLDVSPPVDVLVRAIFEDDRYTDDYEARQQLRANRLQDAANSLLQLGPSAAAGRLAAVEREAAAFGKLSGGWDRRRLYELVAAQAEEPIEWLEAMVAKGIAPEYVNCFVEAAVEKVREQTVAILGRLLNDPRYEQLAARKTLTLVPVESNLGNQGLKRIKLSRNDAYWLENVCVSSRTIGALLQHEDKETRIGVAIAEWHRKGGVRAELKAHWIKVICEIDDTAHELAEILKGDAELAYAWMSARLADAPHILWKTKDVARIAAESLSSNKRYGLLSLLDKRRFDQDWFWALVGDDVELFQRWYGAQQDPYVRLRPLRRGTIDERWERMAIAALDGGCSPEELADACDHVGPLGGFGRLSDMYLKLVPDFERLAGHADERLHLTGQRGIQWAKESAARERQSEDREELFD